MVKKNYPLPWKRVAITSIVLLMFVSFLSLAATAQTTISTGSIVGTISDPQGAVVSDARVTITNTATNQITTVTSNSAGAFNSGALVPGEYRLQVSAKGFS